jgi:hypothetical protein
MAEPSIRLLDAVHIDDGRQFVEFRFKEPGGETHAIQIDFDYVESLAAVFQQAFVSAQLEAQQGGNQALGPQWLAIPRTDIDYPVNVGVDVMTNRIVAMFLLGTPFQVSYSLPVSSAKALAGDLLNACDEVHAQNEAGKRRRAN